MSATTSEAQTLDYDVATCGDVMLAQQQGIDLQPQTTSKVMVNIGHSVHSGGRAQLKTLYLFDAR